MEGGSTLPITFFIGYLCTTFDKSPFTQDHLVTKLFAHADMPQHKKLIDPVFQLRVTSDPGMAAMIQAEIDNMPRKTRAKAQAIKQNALDAGLLLPEKKPKVRKPVLVTHIVYSSDEDSDSEPDDVFESERKPINPWSKISVLESADAWSVWEADEGSYHVLLASTSAAEH